MVNAVTATTDTTAAAAAMKQSVGMNKDDFLKLFIAQLQNQDPLKPQDPEQMLGQLAQLTQVEQAYNTNSALQNLITAQNNSATMNSVAFIGKTVKANGNAVAFDGAAATSMQFNFATPASAATVAISDANGKVVRTAALGPLAAGDTTVSWDGRDSSGNLLPAGAYSFNVTGTAANGASITATTYTTGLIDGLTVVNGTPMLTIGAATVAFSDVISVKGV